MRKTERIDQILIRLGHVTKNEVEQAVARQRQEGGRIGENLIELGALTEEQLFDALVEQFRIPTITVDESVVEQELLDRMPEGALTENLIVPVGWNGQFRVLSLAVANPSDTEAIQEVGRAFGARKVRISLAPESVLADLVLELVGGERERVGRKGRADVRLVALPELFEPEGDEEAPPSPGVGEAAEPLGASRIVMIAGSPVAKNFLPAVFRADGYDLVVTSEPEEAAEAIPGADAVLLSGDIAEAYRLWVEEGRVPEPECEVLRFEGVARTLLDTPAPYSSMAPSVRAAVGAVAELRCASEGVSPPYTLMVSDLEALAERLGLGRLGIDGLNLGVHLLMPVEAGTSIDPFRSFAETIELAHRIRFPWPVDKLLSTCLGLYLGRVELAEASDPREEVLLAAQLLALVWFRHILYQPAEGAEGDPATALRSSLRDLAGRFATLDVVETYLEILAERGGADVEAVEVKVLLVGGEHVRKALGPALERIGGDVLAVADVASGQKAVQEARPSAVIVDHAGLEGELEKACRVFRVDRNALLFVVTPDPDPALVLNLLDLGVDDVFGPPHDFDVVAARIQRALRARSTTTPGLVESKLAAKFDALSFLDLTQMLANGLKSARVDLRSSEGEEAVLFLEKGRPVYAECGALAGPKAVYYVVSWEDEGEFSVHDVSEFPEPNIEESIESLLMEGVRLLDESRA